MRELNDIERDLNKYESELASITREVQKDTPFMPHQLDGHSESYTVTSYTDAPKAKYLQERIAALKDEKANYRQNAMNARINRERVERERTQWRKDQITQNANVLYEQKVDEYMKMNFWGKAKVLFSGKKVKKMNQREIIQEFGSQAIDNMLSPNIQELESQRNAQIERAKHDFSNDPQQLAYAIKATNEYFDYALSQMQTTYDQTLNQMNGMRMK